MNQRLLFFAVIVFAGLFGTAKPARAYVLEGQKWPNGTVAMNLQLSFSGATFPLIDGSTSWNSVAVAATADWNAHMANLQMTTNTTSRAVVNGDGVNSVEFSSTVFGDSFGTDVLAITLRIFTGTTNTEADVLVNTADAWNAYRGNLRGTTYDIRRVLDHEFGHVLGLDHPDQAGQTVTAIMNSVTGNLDHLAVDDISGVEALYGTPVVVTTGLPSLYFQNGTLLGNLTLNPTFLPNTWAGLGGMTTGWQERAIADVNGDGIPDIIFQNGTLVAAVILNSSGLPSLWFGIGAMNSGWQLRGAAQLTGDGNLDLIFQNGTLIGFLEINSSGTPLTWTGIGSMGAGWTLHTVADVTGDDHPDLIFQNGTAIGVLRVGTNGVPISWTGVGSAPTGWTLSDALDVNGDGQPDLIFQNGTGIAAWEITTSLTPSTWHGIGGVGSGWILPGNY